MARKKKSAMPPEEFKEPEFIPEEPEIEPWTDHAPECKPVSVDKSEKLPQNDLNEHPKFAKFRN
jgi:hypothetical protein